MSKGIKDKGSKVGSNKAIKKVKNVKGGKRFNPNNITAPKPFSVTGIKV